MLPQGWADLYALLDGHPDDNPMSRLKRLCAVSVEATGVSGASVSLTSSSARSTVCATDALSDELEDLQDTIGEGPTVDAASVLLTVDQPDDETAAAFVWVLGDESRFRPEVHQAVGATMVHLEIGPREAFARLCAHAYASNTSMAVVAREIMSGRLRLEGD